ncbi:hypothetical protein C2S52_018892 [Perilla frutescens var. hirtella]|nr:hypothetical protein C2S52_018892 [Perilla frutescens var. hirtella]
MKFPHADFNEILFEIETFREAELDDIGRILCKDVRESSSRPYSPRTEHELALKNGQWQVETQEFEGRGSAKGIPYGALSALLSMET